MSQYSSSTETLPVTQMREPSVERLEDMPTGRECSPTQSQSTAHDIEQGLKEKTSDPFLVDWDGPDDPANPYNWSKARKWYITILVSLVTLNISFASSAYTGAIFGIEAQFEISSTVGLLGVTLFVLGFALGPLIFAPMSELFGRNPVYWVTFTVFTVFHIPCALAQNIETILVSRFIGGVFGSSPLTNAGGTLADIWTPLERGRAMSLFALAPFAGPVLGPIVGGFIGQYTSWRWAFWVMFIFAAVVLAFMIFTLPETYAPAILAKKARKLRKETGNKSYETRMEREIDQRSFGVTLKRSLLRPFRLLFTEPIVLTLSVYMAFVYGILYLLFEAFPLVFTGVHGFSVGITGLAFIGVGVGMFAAVAATPISDMLYERTIKANGGCAPPEARLPLSQVGAILLPIGLFWFAWTSFASVHWIVPILAGVPFGAGMVLIFLSILNYLVDAYLMHAASALAANALLRSLFGAAFPLFAIQMFEGMGNQWGASLLGFVALAMAPFPFLFYRYGDRIRARSKFAFGDEELDGFSGH